MPQEIYRSALQLIEEEGDSAAEVARLMAATMLEHGNPEVADVWESIRVAILDVQSTQAGGGATRH